MRRGSVVIVGIGVDVVDLDRFQGSRDRTPALRSRLFGEAAMIRCPPKQIGPFLRAGTDGAGAGIAVSARAGARRLPALSGGSPGAG